MPLDGPSPDESLKRLGGGRWETKDGRFTIEPASGTWSIVDAEETDDLGMPLVRGPFRSLTDAKAAIADARTSAAPASPLAARERRRDAERDDGTEDVQAAARLPGPTDEDRSKTRARTSAKVAARDGSKRTSRTEDVDAEPAEPGWFRDLQPAERGRARRLIERLTAMGASDATSIVRRDLVGDVPALAAHAIERRLAELPADAAAADIADLLVEGRDDELGVRWRIVDGDGRPILVDVPRASRPRR